MKSNVIELTEKDISWPFHGHPHFRLVGHTKEEIDPTPCYSHSVDLVKETLQGVVDQTVDLDVTYYVGCREGTSRTNAWAQLTGYYDYDDPDEETGRDYTYKHKNIVFIHGKRIPPHPAITKYLVAHEYGHHFEYMVAEQLYGDAHSSKMRKDYSEFRAIDEVPYYGAGTWHRCPGEIFACDFRVCLTKVEEDFWPHMGIDHPSMRPEVVKWFEQIVSEPKEKWVKPSEFA